MFLFYPHDSHITPRFQSFHTVRYSRRDEGALRYGYMPHKAVFYFLRFGPAFFVKIYQRLLFLLHITHCKWVSGVFFFLSFQETQMYCNGYMYMYAAPDIVSLVSFLCSLFFMDYLYLMEVDLVGLICNFVFLFFFTLPQLYHLGFFFFFCLITSCSKYMF